MPRFRYTAYTSEGLREVGAIEVATEAQAWDKLTSLGLIVVELLAESVAPQRTSWTELDFRRGIPLKVQADLADQLAVLFAARLSAMQVVETVAQGAVLPAVRRKFHRIGQLMSDGSPFPDALEAVKAGLHPLFISLARIGQTAGNLTPLMRALAITLRREQKLATQIRGALIYPLILVAGGLGILMLMALHLAPQLAAIFISVERPVPAALSFFVVSGSFLRAWWPAFLIAAVVPPIACSVFIANARPRLVGLLHRSPVVGPIARDASLARLVRSVQIMLEAGMPLAPSLRTTAVAMPDDPLSVHFDAASAAIEGGGNGRDIFGRTADLPPMFQALFAIGEQSNTLPQVMDAVATALEDQVERRVQQAMALLTPVLTLAIGGGIAVIVYAVMSALLSVNDLAA